MYSLTALPTHLYSTGRHAGYTLPPLSPCAALPLCERPCEALPRAGCARAAPRSPDSARAAPLSAHASPLPCWPPLLPSLRTLSPSPSLCALPLCSPLCVCSPSLRALPSAGLRGLLRPHEAQAKWKVRCLRATVPARSLCGDYRLRGPSRGLRRAFVGPSLGLRRAFARVLSGLRGSLHGLRRAFAGPSSGLRTPSSELRLTNPHKKPAVRSPLLCSP